MSTPESPLLAPWVQRQLGPLLQQRAHALLLSGPSGLGQYELGLALAASWLCEQPGPEGACHRCPSCHAIAVRTHADLCLLMPETASLALGWPLEETAQRDIDEKKRKPSKFIRVDAARAAIGFAQTTSARGRGKVVLVHPAERLNMESANTLLKTLEEPGGDLRFVLCTEAADQLLPTIRSRCVSHTMQTPDETEALTWLCEQAKIGQGDARTWWRAGGGRPAAALALAQGGWTPSRWLALPRAVLSGDWGDLAEQPAAVQLDVLHKVCHDLMALAAGAKPRFFEASSLPAPPSWRALAVWSRELSQAARSVEHPFHAGLQQEAWASRARQLLAAPPRQGAAA